MCILSYIPAGVAVTDRVIDGLARGGENNPHGHGWAIVAGEKILTGKSMNLNKALTEFRSTHSELLSPGPALFHSRWATHGSRSVANCHPFIVGGSAKTVVAHNGVLPADAWPDKNDDRSDTRLFADDILPTRYRRLDKPSAFDALTRWAGRGNKLVILTVDPCYRKNAYLVNADRGVWDEQTGVWHSNSDYLDRWESYASALDTRSAACAYKSAEESAAVFSEHGGMMSSSDWEQCEFCAYGYLDDWNYCLECGMCNDCTQDIIDCQCRMTQAERLKALELHLDVRFDGAIDEGYAAELANAIDHTSI